MVIQNAANEMYQFITTKTVRHFIEHTDTDEVKKTTKKKQKKRRKILFKLCKLLESCTCMCTEKCHKINEVFVFFLLVQKLLDVCARIFQNVVFLSFLFVSFFAHLVTSFSMITSYSRIFCFSMYFSLTMLLLSRHVL